MEYFRWKIVFETGWTLEQVDGLSMADFIEYIQVTDGMAKARNSLLK